MGVGERGHKGSVSVIIIAVLLATAQCTHVPKFQKALGLLEGRGMLCARRTGEVAAPRSRRPAVHREARMEDVLPPHGLRSAPGCVVVQRGEGMPEAPRAWLYRMSGCLRAGPGRQAHRQGPGRVWPRYPPPRAPSATSPWGCRERPLRVQSQEEATAPRPPPAPSAPLSDPTNLSPPAPPLLPLRHLQSEEPLAVAGRPRPEHRAAGGRIYSPSCLLMDNYSRG